MAGAAAPPHAAVDGGGSAVTVPVVEARDRAFMAHVLLHNMSIESVVGFDARATPTRQGVTSYLQTAELHTARTATQCTRPSSVGGTAACVVFFGPSVELVNYVPTTLAVRVRCADGSTSAWAVYAGYVYPTKSMTIENVRRHYRVPPNYQAPPADARQAVANFLGIYVSPDDIESFDGLMGVLPQPPLSFHGPNNASDLTDVEGSIDVQWMRGVGQGVPAEYWSTTGGRYGHEPFLDWLVDVSNMSSPPLVFSLSYGENEGAYARAYEERFNVELLKLGLRGVSVFAASGDTGVQGAAQPGGAPPRCAPFAPTFPAASPYVTSVGGTQFSDHVTEVCDESEVYAFGTTSAAPFACPDDVVGEIACSTITGAMITTGGGFSNRWERPKWQDDAVSSYLAHAARRAKLPNASLFNATGRGYPDIAAIGQNVPTVFNGSLAMVGGTSASAPIAAALFSMINAERLAAGMPPLGFVNPWLYRVYQTHHDVMLDVKVGNNSGGNKLLPVGLDVSCPEAFAALPGWDPTTGLGAPNFAKLLLYAMQPCELRPRTKRAACHARWAV